MSEKEKEKEVKKDNQIEVLKKTLIELKKKEKEVLDEINKINPKKAFQRKPIMGKNRGK